MMEEKLHISCYFMLLKPDRSERNQRRGEEGAAVQRRRAVWFEHELLWRWETKGLCGIKTSLAAVQRPPRSRLNHAGIQTLPPSASVSVCRETNLTATDTTRNQGLLTLLIVVLPLNWPFKSSHLTSKCMLCSAMILLNHRTVLMPQRL